MTNPYAILEVSQNVRKTELLKAQMNAMKKKKYALPEIALASKQLLDPAKRLAADFMFPARIKTKRIQTVVCNLTYQKLDTDTLNENIFDSLK